MIRSLQRLLYSVEKLLRFRAAEALGKVSAVIAGTDPGAVSKLLQGLITSVSDTAASSWGALNAVGEIVSQSPGQFAGYVPHLYPFARDRALLADVLRALGTISAKSPDLVRKKAHQFVPLLQDPDPEIRSASAVLLGNLGANEAREGLAVLAGDSSRTEIYRNGVLEEQTVGGLALEALEKL